MSETNIHDLVSAAIYAAHKAGADELVCWTLTPRDWMEIKMEAPGHTCAVLDSLDEGRRLWGLPVALALPGPSALEWIPEPPTLAELRGSHLDVLLAEQKLRSHARQRTLLRPTEA